MDVRNIEGLVSNGILLLISFLIVIHTNLGMAAASDSFRFLAATLIQKTERLRDILAVIGLFYAGKLAVDTSAAFLSAFHIFLLSKFRSLSNFKQRYGPWAIVTGATDGIGKEYARELARLGLNIILMSRSHEKLTRVAQEIGNSPFKDHHLLFSLMLGFCSFRG